MQLRLKPYHKNLYTVNSLFIYGETVLEWITAICQLNIELQKVEVYAVPGTKANTLYGCVLFFNNTALPKDIRNHQYLQYAENKLLIPAQSVFLPAVEEEELIGIEPGKKILLHPVAGTVVLGEPVDWEALLLFEEAASIFPKKPVTGVFVPGSINAYTLELSDEKLINDLLNPPSQKEIMDNLPFDVKKLMKGNKREMEKYLKYLEAHPDKALDIALPLDVMGSFRGDNKGRFSFSGNWGQRFFGGSNKYAGNRGDYTGNRTGNWWWIGIAIVLIVRSMTSDIGTTERSGHPVEVKPAAIKNISVLDSHYNSIMAAKNIALLQLITGKHEGVEKISETYSSEKQKLKESGKKIRDSLIVLYTAITNSKTDSVIKKWKRFAADSIKRNYGKTNYQLLLGNAITKKREITYHDYAVYYGIIEEGSAAGSHQQKNKPGRTAKKATANGSNNTGYIFLLTLALISVALLFVRLQAPETDKGKIGAGQGEMSVGRILLLMIIMTVSIIYILQPLLETYGFGWLSISVCLLLLLLLYRLFGKGLTIFRLDNE